MDGVKNKTKAWAPKIFLLLIAVVWLALLATSWAEAAAEPAAPPPPEEMALNDEGPSRAPASARRKIANEDAEAAPRPSDTYDFNWLDPDKRIYVLQNRRYLKAGHPMLSLLVGPNFSNAYRTTYNIDPRFTYYFSEQFGIEGFYTYSSNKENSTYTALLDATPTSSGSGGVPALPIIREIKSQYGGMLVWAPWYAKINVFNKILYFDWYIAAGVGQVKASVDTRTNKDLVSNFVDQSYTAIYWATGQLFHVNEHFKVRLDFRGGNYSAPINGLTGNTTWYTNYDLGLGVAFSL